MSACARVGASAGSRAGVIECGAGAGCFRPAWVGVCVECSVSRSDGLSGMGWYVWACSG